MRRSALVAILVALLGLSAMAVSPAVATPTHSGTTITVNVQENGDAAWSVSARYNLSDENDTAAFERLRSEYESGTTDVGPTADLFRSAVADVSARTDREMQLTGVTRSTELVVENDSKVGVLTLSFTWTNFATIEGETISVGSAFAGGWFGDLSETQTLRIEPPSGYTVQTASPSTDIIGGALLWNGPQVFGPGEPQIGFTPAVTTTVTTTTTTTTDSTPTTPTTPPAGIRWTYPAIGFGVFLLLGLLLLAWHGGYLGGSEGEGDEGGPPSDGGVEPEPQAETGPTEGAGAPGEEGGPEETAGAGAGAETEEGAGAIDTDLLSDEERIERILREHGGRMKQAQIVEETRWSNAKVSQVLSAMAEDGQVEKLRIGRENLISLPEYEEDES